MRALKPVLAVLCIFSLAFAGETGKIAGRVTEAGTDNPLIGTNVIVEGTSLGAATDENGEYFIINRGGGGDRCRSISYGRYPGQWNREILGLQWSGATRSGQYYYYWKWL